MCFCAVKLFVLGNVMLKKGSLGNVKERTTSKSKEGKFIYHNKHTMCMVGPDLKKKSNE